MLKYVSICVCGSLCIYSLNDLINNKQGPFCIASSGFFLYQLITASYRPSFCTREA